MAEETQTQEAQSAPEQSAPAQQVIAPAPAPAGINPAARSVQKAFTDLAPELAPVEESERQAVEGGRTYEITFIVQANKPEALESSQKSVRAIIEGGGGAVDGVRVSEVRRLAYPIKKQGVNRSEGVYVVVNARFNKSLVEQLERFFKLEEAILRHIVLRDGE